MTRQQLRALKRAARRVIAAQSAEDEAEFRLEAARWERRVREFELKVLVADAGLPYYEGQHRP